MRPKKMLLVVKYCYRGAKKYSHAYIEFRSRAKNKDGLITQRARWQKGFLAGEDLAR